MKLSQVRRLRIHQIEYMYWIIAIMVFLFTINNSTYKSVFPSLAEIIKWVLIFFRLILVFIGASCIIGNKQNTRDVLLIFVYSLFFLLSYFFTKSWDLFDALFISIFLYKKLKYDKVIRAFYTPLLLSFFCVIVGYFVGLLPDMLITRSDGTPRMSYGFFHPNDLSRVVMLMVFLHVLKNKHELGVKNLVFIALMAMFTYILPNSKDVSFSLAIFCFLLISREVSIRFKKKDIFATRQFYFFFITVLFGIISLLWFLESYSSYDDIIKSIAYNVYSRFSSARTALLEYGFTTFGHNLQFAAEASLRYGWATQYFTLDSVYFYIPIARGLVPSVFILILYLYNIRVSLKKQDSIILMEMFVFMVYSMLEPGILYFIASFIFILPKIDRGDPKVRN